MLNCFALRWPCPFFYQEEAKKRQGWEQYGNVPLSVVYIYRCKPTLGMAIEGGANTRQPLPKVINVQVRQVNSLPKHSVRVKEG